MTPTTRKHHRASEYVWVLGTAGLLAGMCAAAGTAQLWKLLIIAVVSCHIFYIKRRFFYL